jgi:hypothetical protein
MEMVTPGFARVAGFHESLEKVKRGETLYMEENSDSSIEAA